MKSRSGLTLLALLALVLTGLTLSAARSIAMPLPAAGVAQDRDDWQAPPSEFREAQRQGFHDGIEGARKDFDNHRLPSVENREEYRHPHVPRDLRGDYREGFRQGYERAMSHLNSLHY
jgi:hypothetical protein